MTVLVVLMKKESLAAEAGVGGRLLQGLLWGGHHEPKLGREEEPAGQE